MANGQDETQHTQSTDGAGDDSGIENKLIFGKYKTQDEAEKGHKELERAYHEGNERYVKLESRLNQLETSRSDEESYGRGQVYQTGVPVAPISNGTETLTRFYSDPDRTLAEVEERAAQRAEQRITARQRQASDYAARVNRWTTDNQDVAPYGDLLTHYVSQTDARLAPETRLDEAAKIVRKRVLELKSKSNQQNNDPMQFVDGASGSSADGGQRNAAAAPVSGESELKRYVNERSALTHKPLQHGGSRK